MEEIWAAFKAARIARDVEAMSHWLVEFDLEYDGIKHLKHAPQKHMARRGSIIRSIETLREEKTQERLRGGVGCDLSGSW